MGCPYCIRRRRDYSLWGENNTTNNQMEMMAAIKALEYFQEKKSIELVTDSSYLKDGIEKWIHGWKKNGWKTSAKKQVKNPRTMDEDRCPE